MSCQLLSQALYQSGTVNIRRMSLICFMVWTAGVVAAVKANAFALQYLPNTSWKHVFVSVMFASRLSRCSLAMSQRSVVPQQSLHLTD